MTVPFRVYLSNGVQVSTAAETAADAIDTALRGTTAWVERVTYLDGFREVEVLAS